MGLQKWTDTYPQGTQEGIEEAKFFKTLSRAGYKWRSISAMVNETKLSRERIEQLINKYYNKGMLIQSPTDPEKWGYWESVPDYVPKSKKSMSKDDQDERIKKAIS